MVFHKLYLFLNPHYFFKMAVAVFYVETEGPLKDILHHRLLCVSPSAVTIQFCLYAEHFEFLISLMFWTKFFTLLIEIKLRMLLKCGNFNISLCVCVCAHVFSPQRICTMYCQLKEHQKQKMKPD